MHEITSNANSPFDSIRHTDEHGTEFWYARELMSIIGYKEWRNFSLVIKKVERSIQNSDGSSIDDVLIMLIPPKSNMNVGIRTKSDYRLSRRACYLAAINGDPEKPEIAAAQAYFVAKTREAELGLDKKNAPSLKTSLSELSLDDFTNLIAVNSFGYLATKEEIDLLTQGISPDLVNTVGNLSSRDRVNIIDYLFALEDWKNNIAIKLNNLAAIDDERIKPNYLIGDPVEIELMKKVVEAVEEIEDAQGSMSCIVESCENIKLLDLERQNR